MTQDDVTRLRALAAMRVASLDGEDRQLRRWLTWTRISGWPLHAAGIVLPVAAGAKALAGVIDGTDVALIAFAGAAASALHTSLGCEAYQEGLKVTAQLTRRVLEAFEYAGGCPDPEVEAAFRKAEDMLEQLRQAGKDLPPRRLRLAPGSLGAPVERRA